MSNKIINIDSLKHYNDKINQTKQDVLISGQNIKTLNGESILGSGDITISGGSSSGAYSEVNHGTSDTTFTLTPNTFHVWDEVASLTLDFGSETSGEANEFLFQFTSGATATSLTLPDDIKWANDNAPTIEANMIYQVSVLKGLASVLEFSKGRIDNPIFVSETDAIGYEFTYPTASELIIVYQGVYGMTPDLTLPVGTTSFQCPSGKDGDQRGDILSITPQNDAIYNYILL